MKLSELLSVVDEAKPTKSYCSKTPKSKMSASWKSSCISQGEVAHDSGKSQKIGGKRIDLKGKKIKGKDHGGPLPDYS